MSKKNLAWGSFVASFLIFSSSFARVIGTIDEPSTPSSQPDIVHLINQFALDLPIMSVDEREKRGKEIDQLAGEHTEKFPIYGLPGTMTFLLGFHPTENKTLIKSEASSEQWSFVDPYQYPALAIFPIFSGKGDAPYSWAVVPVYNGKRFKMIFKKGTELTFRCEKGSLEVFPTFMSALGQAERALFAKIESSRLRAAYESFQIDILGGVQSAGEEPLRSSIRYRGKSLFPTDYYAVQRFGQYKNIRTWQFWQALKLALEYMASSVAGNSVPKLIESILDSEVSTVNHWDPLGKVRSVLRGYGLMDELVALQKRVPTRRELVKLLDRLRNELQANIEDGTPLPSEALYNYRIGIQRLAEDVVSERADRETNRSFFSIDLTLSALLGEIISTEGLTQMAEYGRIDRPWSSELLAAIPGPDQEFIRALVGGEFQAEEAKLLLSSGSRLRFPQKIVAH